MNNEYYSHTPTMQELDRHFGSRRNVHLELTEYAMSGNRPIGIPTEWNWDDAYCQFFAPKISVFYLLFHFLSDAFVEMNRK